MSDKKKAPFFVLMCMLLFVGILTGCNLLKPQNIYAATSSKPKLLLNADKNESKEIYMDLNGDGTKEKVSIYVTFNDLYETVSTLNIDVNGENVLSLEDLGFVAHIYSLDLLTQKYIYIVDAYSNGDPTVDAVYYYNQSAGSLDQVLSLDTTNTKNGVSHLYSTVATSKNTIKVTYSGQMDSTGYIDWIFEYKLKNGKFVLKNNTAKIIKKWHKGNFVTQKKLTFYKKAGSAKKSFTIKSGTVVKIQKIKLIKNTYYLQFKYKKKTGWIKANKANIFRNVVLAG